MHSSRIGIPEKGALARASGTLDRKFGNNLFEYLIDTVAFNFKGVWLLYLA